MAAESSKKHARADSKTHEDYMQVENALKHPSTKRAKQIDSDTPFNQLHDILEKTRKDVKPRNVLHWFRSKDLRQEDNKGLHAASQKAKEGSGGLLTIKQIPLAIVTAPDRGTKSDKVLEFVKQNDVSHIYADMEYEVAELRRDIDLAKKVQGEKDLSLDVLHDQTVVVPGALRTGSGGPHKLFTPYHKMWLSVTKDDSSLLETVPPPEGNDKSVSKQFHKLFDTEIPELPESKQFPSKEERERIRSLWPAGNEAGMGRLKHFLHDKVATYSAHRSEPAYDATSRLSPYFSSGIVSVREVLPETKKFNQGKHFDEGDRGVDSWVREIVFREFYRQVLAITPHTSVNLPQNLQFDFVEWEDDEEGWKKWCEGRTGVPFVDAGMRQINHEAYMRNRLRMNTSSYLRANLLIDYRKGERYFAEHLVDWDLSNNTQGWEPSYTVFNPVSQGKKCDKDGDYIRKWVPELESVKGDAIFEPHAKLSKAEFEKLGYPYPHVDYAESSRRAKARYKQDLANADP
ncbi:Uu.00g143370.m01.CDS01 [Anthostomella pinea]|uniref:Uu.00g143370.m01.CDS01 n=1 Tax=Anthostomella pinea TaxID=933095 RepID=A0AAI8VQL7_9PEZI|nr:Uu.00g143370.m01.CDS01 [Anthostomella pinea]